MDQQIDVIYCAKGSICSRRSKATVLSRKENTVDQNRHRSNTLAFRDTTKGAIKPELAPQNKMIHNVSLKGESISFQAELKLDQEYLIR